MIQIGNYIQNPTPPKSKRIKESGSYAITMAFVALVVGVVLSFGFLVYKFI